MEITERQACCLLSTMGLSGPQTILRMKEFAGSFSACLNTPPEEFTALNGFAGKRAAELGRLQRVSGRMLEEYAGFAGRGIHVICIDDEDYPERLKLIPDPPLALYVLGRLPDDDKPSAAIIGARMCSDYGISAAEYFAGELSQKGIQIISGMACGIDAAASRGALDRGSDSFAVLGCGVDICYPSDSRDIYELMSGGGYTHSLGSLSSGPGTGPGSPSASGYSRASPGSSSPVPPRGGIISEFWPGSQPLSRHFIRRNRIIAGLGDILIVIEARERSGTSITVGYALDQGKDVFALPGRITDPLGRGCNKLLKDGAIPLTEPSDVLDYFGIEETGTGQSWDRNLLALSEKEKKVYQAMDFDSMHLEDIASACGMKLGETMNIIASLELKHYAVNTGKVYYKKL